MKIQESALLLFLLFVHRSFQDANLTSFATAIRIISPVANVVIGTLPLFLLFVHRSFQDANLNPFTMFIRIISLFVHRSFQDANLNSFTIFIRIISLFVNAVLGIPQQQQDDQIVPYTRNSVSTFSSCSTSRIVLSTKTGHQQPTLSPARPFHITNASNATIIEQAPPNDLNSVLPRKRTANQTTESGGYSKNTTQPPNDLSDRLVAHQRRGSKVRKPLVWEGDGPSLKPPKSQTVPNAELAALGANALYLASLDPDKRRKRQKTQEQDKTLAPSSIGPCNTILQPESRPISQQQLDSELEGIYTRLVMAEAKCIEIDYMWARVIASGDQPVHSNEQWQALIALHRTLLHEHHDFLLASQHSFASAELRRLASKHDMPARMCRYGIHSFLEILGYHLPESLDHMLSFIYFAHSIVASLYETAPAFKDIWMESLGDLARYRMAIENNITSEKEIWAGVARYWYSKASDRAPTTGRLYHHLAILAKPNALAQLSYYSKSLCTPIPYDLAQESILTLFDQALNVADSSEFRLSPLDLAFMKTHKILFENNSLEGFESQIQEFINLLDNQIERVTREFVEQGCHIAIANSIAMLGFGSKNSLLIRLMDTLPKQPSEPLDHSEGLSSNNEFFYSAQKLANETLNITLRRLGDSKVLPLVHVSLTFIHLVSRHTCTKRFLQIGFPWESLVKFLNVLLSSYDASSGAIAMDIFPIPAKANARPLPEDFALRGLLWAEDYFPKKWFSEGVDHEDNTIHFASKTQQRTERILWLAIRIAKAFPTAVNYHPASYDPSGNKFNKPRFSVATGVSCARSSLLGLNQSTSCLSIENDPRFNGISATLALPLDPSEGSLDRYLSTPQGSSEDLSYLTEGSAEIFESWLSDLIDVDIAQDDSDRIKDSQTEANSNQNTSTDAEKLLPSLNATATTDMTVFYHAESSNHSSNDLAENLRIGEWDDKDDQKQQDFKEKEGCCIISTSKSQDGYNISSIATSTISPLDDKYSPDPLIRTPLQLSPKSILGAPWSPLASLKASESPIASLSALNQIKTYKCTYCQKEFARIDIMNKHIKYHTKPISCQVPGCGYRCGRQQDLSRHQHGFHKDIFGEEEFPCPFEECKKLGVKYSRKDNLGRHLKKQHNGDRGGHERNNPQ